MCPKGPLLPPLLYLSTHPAPCLVPPETTGFIDQGPLPTYLHYIMVGKYVDVSIGTSAPSFTVSVYTPRTLLGATRD